MNQKIKELSIELLKIIDQTSNVNVIFFTASWCDSCKMMYPVISRLNEERLKGVDVYIVDIDKHQEIVDELQVFSIPTTLIRFKGKTYHKESGYRSIDLLQKYIQMIINTF